MVHTKDKRAIIIKSPKLRKIRKFSRDLLFQAASSKRKEYYDEWRDFLVKSDGTRRSINDLSSDELKRKEARKKPSKYKRDSYIFRVQALPKPRKRRSRSYESHDEKAIEELYRTFIWE